MSQEERQALLHEGTGIATLSAYVEIVFDNSDNRLPTGRPEVSLRRTIGLKKDEFSLDRKVVTKTEVENLLTTAGLPKANPYNIVPQGRITWLTSAKDGERLELLKEVAGTRVYEENRRESFKIIEETDYKRAKIDEMLQHIEERIGELEGEKQDLVEFSKLDREKKCCEFTILSRQLRQTEQELADLGGKYASNLKEVGELEEGIEISNQELSQKEASLHIQRADLANVEDQLTRLRDERDELLKEKAQFEFNLRDNAAAGEEKRKLEIEYAKVGERLSSKREELDNKIVPALEGRSAAEAELRQKIALLEVERDHLAELKGRKICFKTEKDRNSWIKKEIEDLSVAIENESRLRDSLQGEISLKNEQMTNLSGDISHLKQQYEVSRMALERDKQSKQLIQQRNQLNEGRKEAWRVDSDLQHELGSKKGEIQKLEKSIFLSGGKGALASVQAVNQVALELKVAESVYGPLFQLFEADPVYFNAIDTVAGSSLFYVAVDTDETARKILNVLCERRLGRVTFVPLNQINSSREASHPREGDLSKNEGFSVLSVMKFEPQFEPIFRVVFSRAFICCSLEVAARVSKDYRLTTVTLDGDKVDKRGALSGGFNHHRNQGGTRLHTLVAIASLTREVQGLSGRIDRNTATIQSLDREINALLSEIFQEEHRHRQNTEVLGEQRGEISRRQQAFNQMLQACEEKTRLVRGCDMSIEALGSKIQSLERESLQPFKSSTFDEGKYNATLREIEALSKQLSTVLKEKVNLGCFKNAISIEIESCLEKRLEEIDELLRSKEESGPNVVCSSSTKECDEKLSAAESKTNDLVKLADELGKKVRETLTSIESLGLKIEERTLSLAKIRSSPKFLSLKAVLSQKREDLNQKIRELGIVSSEAYDSFSNLDDKKVNERLKGFNHVNRKAAEQYSSFRNQRDALISRRDELIRSSRSIRSFIENLDQQKDDMILRTFDQVAAHFSETFSKLAPRGKGGLSLVREEVPNASGEVVLTGIQVKVSFDSVSHEAVLMQQLSGGQKSVVALALIFAIQKVDPAPFYLFDEIDANLDVAYRTAVADLIEGLSRNAQYIVTTFRPELLQRADKFYGVQFVDRLSQIATITKEVAMEFIGKEVAPNK